MEKDYNTITIPAWFAEFNEAPRHVTPCHNWKPFALLVSVVTMFIGAATEPFVPSVVLVLVALGLLAAAYFA